jgi:membrane protein required for colicin V production
MAPADWVILAVLAVSVLAACKQGFFLSAFSLGGVVLGLLLASWHYQRLVGPMGKFIDSIEARQVVSFLLIALGVMIVCGLLGRLFKALFHRIGLGWADRLLGAVFGFLRGAVVVTLGVMAIAAFLPQKTWLEHSQFATYFLNAAHGTAAVTPADFANKIRSGVKTIREAQPDWLRPHA